MKGGRTTRGPARGGLAHRRARRLDGRGRRALPPGGGDPRRLARGARRRRRRCSRAAASAGPAGRGADERRRARDPLRRRLRSRGARAAAARARRRVTRLAELLPREASLANPVDMLGSAVAATYEDVLPHVLADPGIDAVIVLFVPPVVAGAEEVAEAAFEASRRRRRAASPCSRLSSARRASRAACCAAARRSPHSSIPSRRRAHWRTRSSGRSGCARPAGGAPELDEHRPSGGRGARRLGARRRRTMPGWTRRRCASCSTPTASRSSPSGRRSPSTTRVAAARELGLPVVVKSAVPGAHKSESGGVALDLARRGGRCVRRSSASARPCSSSR